MTVTRLRTDELASAWVGDRCTPFQLGLVGAFDAAPFRRPDGTLDIPRVRGELAGRARRVPALALRVVRTRFGQGRPVWAADPLFDPAAHVGWTTLPAAADLTSWAANEVVRPLPKDRPLWRVEVVDGLRDGRFAVIIVVHHLVADGLAGVALAGQLLDAGPDAVVAPVPPGRTPALPSHRELVREHVKEVRSALRRAVRPPRGGRPGGSAGLAQLRTAMADFAGPEPVTSLPRRVGPGRRLAVVTEPLEDLRCTAHALSVTMNDLLLAAVTGGLRALLIARGEDITGLVLRTTVPAATGRAGQVAGMLVVRLPVGEPDPARRLTLITAATRPGKSRLRASGRDGAAVLDLPVPIARPVVRLARRLGSRRISLSVSDVVGPTAPLWLAGARLLDATPVAPLVPAVPLSVAALSYCGALAVSVNADASVTDLGRLADGLTGSFAVLHALACA
jgi:WS/DGAT/MGAT family acyltransferase